MPCATKLPPARRARAATLAEILVAAGLLLLLGLVLVALLRSSLSHQQRTLLRANLQQQLQLALQRMSRDLQQSALGGIGVAEQRISLQRIADISSDLPPRPFWETLLVLYFVNEGGLWQRLWPPEPPALGISLSSSHPFRPDAHQLQQLCRPERARLVARNAVRLQLSDPATLPLSLSLELADEGLRLQATRVLTLRNSE